MNIQNKGALKGANAEECLRSYFRSLGYFVVRGVPYFWAGELVTDIDLWLYKRHSPFARERVNVDIKDKRKPKAMERVLVARGIQESLTLDRCIVATSDRREDVERFGTQAGATIIGGGALARLKTNYDAGGRLSEEQLERMLDFSGLGKLTGNWAQRLRESKSWLVEDLNFDGCGRWLRDGGEFLRAAIENAQRREAALRLAYLSLAYFLVGLDHSLSSSTYASPEALHRALADGLRFGAGGRGRFERVARQAAQLAAAVGGPTAPQLESQLKTSMLEADFPLVDLAEYLARPSRSNALVGTGCKIERYAYETPIVQPKNADADVKALLGAVLDAHGLDRLQVVNVLEGPLARAHQVGGDAARAVAGQARINVHHLLRRASVAIASSELARLQPVDQRRDGSLRSLGYGTGTEFPVNEIPRLVSGPAGLVDEAEEELPLPLGRAKIIYITPRALGGRQRFTVPLRGVRNSPAPTRGQDGSLVRQPIVEVGL